MVCDNCMPCPAVAAGTTDKSPVAGQPSSCLRHSLQGHPDTRHLERQCPQDVSSPECTQIELTLHPESCDADLGSRLGSATLLHRLASRLDGEHDMQSMYPKGSQVYVAGPCLLRAGESLSSPIVAKVCTGGCLVVDGHSQTNGSRRIILRYRRASLCGWASCVSSQGDLLLVCCQRRPPWPLSADHFAEFGELAQLSELCRPGSRDNFGRAGLQLIRKLLAFTTSPPEAEIAERQLLAHAWEWVVILGGEQREKLAAELARGIACESPVVQGRHVSLVVEMVWAHVHCNQAGGGTDQRLSEDRVQRAVRAWKIVAIALAGGGDSPGHGGVSEVADSFVQSLQAELSIAGAARAVLCMPRRRRRQLKKLLVLADCVSQGVVQRAFDAMSSLERVIGYLGADAVMAAADFASKSGSSALKAVTGAVDSVHSWGLGSFRHAAELGIHSFLGNCDRAPAISNTHEEVGNLAPSRGWESGAGKVRVAACAQPATTKICGKSASSFI